MAVSAVAGYIFLVAITLHLPDLTPLFPADLSIADPAVYSQYYFGDGAAVLFTLNENLDAGLAAVLGGGIAIAMCFCGLSSVASAGRMLFAFSRDDGIPGSGWLKKRSKQSPSAFFSSWVLASVSRKVSRKRPRSEKPTCATARIASMLSAGETRTPAPRAARKKRCRFSRIGINRRRFDAQPWQ